MEFKEPYVLDAAYGGPEYETIGALGTSCYISDIKAVSKGNELCNAYGLDTISAGMVISFAMECFENGLLTLKDTGGIDLRFGNAEAMWAVLKAIGERRGIGDILADGCAKAAQKIGKGAGQYAMHVKGLEVPMHEPRLKAGLGLGYMVNPHGADHCCNMQDIMYTQPGRRTDQLVRLGLSSTPLPTDDISPQKVALFRTLQLTQIVRDCVPICMFLPYDAFQTADITAAVTGWDTTVMEQLRAAERTVTMFRLTNIREGFASKDDKLPERFFQGKSGALAGKPLSHEKMEKALRYYYTLMGWDNNGVPLREKVEELGIPL
jgi:aldehyde:ferredoxin oxidoreductase